MSYAALESQGTVLKISNLASPEVFTAISEITSISGPAGTANEYDVSDLDSTMREMRTGLAGHGSITLDMFYIPDDTVHAQIRTAWKARTRQHLQLIFTDSPATTWTFYARITQFQISLSVDNALKVSVGLTVDGDITET